MTSRPITFSHLFKYLNRPKRQDVFVVLEKRNKSFIKNYGEIPIFINRADGDPWDVIVPGYPKLETDKPIKLKKLLGVYTLPNGNHKLIIDVQIPHKKDYPKSYKDVLSFQKKYEKHTKLAGSVIYF